MRLTNATVGLRAVSVAPGSAAGINRLIVIIVLGRKIWPKPGKDRENRPVSPGMPGGGFRRIANWGRERHLGRGRGRIGLLPGQLGHQARDT
jgi:hypothetical protein